MNRAGAHRVAAGQRAGFSLVEVLIAVGIMAVLGLVAAALLRVGAVTGAASGARSGLIQEAQMTQQLIAGRLSEALWVYPNMSAGSAAFVLAASGPTTLNNAGPSGGQRWRVREDPFVAMVLPPRGPGGNCTTRAEGDPNSEGCFRFFAYYAVNRADLAGTSLSSSSKPKPDAANPDSLVLMEYRANLFDIGGAWVPNFSDGALTSPPAGSYYQSRPGRLLADYVQPGSVSFCVTPPTAAGQLSGRVTFTFNMQRAVLGTTQQIKSDLLKTTVTPRNWRTISILPAPTPACP